MTDNSTKIYIDSFKEYQKKGYTVVIQRVRGYYQVQEMTGLHRREVSTSCTWKEALESYVGILKTIQS